MNNMELATVYLPILDEIYKNEAKTAILEGDEATVKKDGYGNLKVAKLSMDGLGDFSRNSGYTQGSTSFVWETIEWDKERSQDLRIDRLDNEENLELPFAKLSGEFIRTKVIPETDAARLAKLASTQGITFVNEALSSGADVIAALRACTNAFNEAEVPKENRILFITPTFLGLVKDLDTTKSKEVLAEFSTIIETPQTRMYTRITLNDGTSSYGYKKAAAEYKATTDAAVVEGKTYYTKNGDVYSAVAEPATANIASYYEMTAAAGTNLNFLAVEKSAAVCAMNQYIKYFAPDDDQNGDSHVFKYRNNNLYGHVYENKLAGIYASAAPSA
ncbi:MAG: hypothetical protein UIH27_14340 [Ruminococcus sp.]|nr:hypothetical protein [Ruminococcus sp.]